jgi:DNA-binding NarL/FixJ family response regulator
VRIRIVLAAGHAFFREGLKLLLDRSGIDVVGEAANGVELINMARDRRPDLVLAAMAIPLLNGIDAAAEIRREYGIPGILLSMNSDSRYVQRAKSRGLAGFVMMSKDSRQLVETIRQVHAGIQYFGHCPSEIAIDDDEAEEPLTARERQVLQMVAEGHSTKEMAYLMGITVRTGESYRGSVMEKLNIHSTAGLVRYALRQGLTQL